MPSINFFDCMCFKTLRKYFTGKSTEADGKIQSREMESEKKHHIAQLVVFARWDLVNTITNHLIEAFPKLYEEAKK